jgi:hypothetical protein
MEVVPFYFKKMKPWGNSQDIWQEVNAGLLCPLFKCVIYAVLAEH